MSRTKPSFLWVLAILAAALFYAIDSLLFRFAGGFLPLGWGSAICVGGLAVTLASWGWHVKDRLPKLSKNDEGQVIALRSQNPLHPLAAARTLAVAMAASRAGALLVGGYAGAAVVAVARWQIEAAHIHAAVAVATLLASLGLLVVGLWIEKMCTLPPPPSAEATLA